MAARRYDKNYQIRLINFMLNDATSFARCRNIIKDDYFSDELKPTIRVILEHSEKYKAIPTKEQILASIPAEIDLNITGEPIANPVWFLDEIEKFCRYRAIENAVLRGMEYLDEDRYADLEKAIKDAVTISLISDLGDDYYTTTKQRMDRLRDRTNIVSTGWKVLDYKLNGGYQRGSLNIFAGGSGSGKSLFLQNNALNWSLAGMHVVYITLELSQDLVGNRIDSMVSKLSTWEINKNPDELCYKIETFRKTQSGKIGSLQIKKMSEAGTTCNDIIAYLKEYEIKYGRKPDALLVDYLDLLYPNNAKVDTNSLFTKDKYVAEELRSIASEWDIPVVSASQLNRSSVEAVEFDHSHIAGGISKINTADNVFGIFTSLSMREGGKYQLQLLKTRSSDSVGKKIDLKYEPKFMRISDMDDLVDDREDDDADKETVSIKPDPVVNVAPSSKDKIADMLANLRNDTK